MIGASHLLDRLQLFGGSLQINLWLWSSVSPERHHILSKLLIVRTRPLHCHSPQEMGKYKLWRLKPHTSGLELND